MYQCVTVLLALYCGEAIRVGQETVDEKQDYWSDPTSRQLGL